MRIDFYAGRFLCGCIAIMAVLPARGDDPKDKFRRYADVESWVGNVQYAFTDSWNEPVGIAKRTGGQTEHGTLTMNLDKIKVTKAGVEWRGTGTTSSSVNVRDRLAAPQSGYEWAWSSSGPFEQVNNFLEIDFAKGWFRAGAGGGKSKSIKYSIHYWATKYHNYGKSEGSWSPNSTRLIEDEPLPDPGAGLSGSKSFDPLPKQIRTLHLGTTTLIQKPNSNVTVSWTFAPVWRDIELEVTVDDYEKWLPQAAFSERLPGNNMIVHAELKAKDGKPLKYQAKKITFELLNTSKEPGVCMNWPPKESLENEPFDLRFDLGNNSKMLTVDDQFQKTSTNGEKCIKATAVVTCYDWGAWADLKVTAELEDGRVLVGHLKDKPQTILVPIPKRQPSSFIADAWKEKNGVPVDLDDASDDDKSPGSDHDGDGFSLYEEYRGFMVNRQHLRTDPAVKDLFIYDEVGGQVVRGFATFKRGTGITPHYQLRPQEFRANRVMNFNRSGRSPRLYDEPQHGIRVRNWDNPLFSHILTEKEGPTVPKYVEALELSPKIMPFAGRMDGFMRDNGIVLSDVTAGVIAHEMSHACCVWHHGESDPRMRLWRRDKSVNPPVVREFALDDNLEIGADPKNANRADPGKIIRVFSENKYEILAEDPMFDNDWTLYVATYEGGQHSGDENCYMRYAAASAYIRAKNPERFRALVEDGEMKGSILCKSAAGTGINLSTRDPWPRYGNASKKETIGPAERGNCQRMVNLRDSSVP